MEMINSTVHALFASLITTPLRFNLKKNRQKGVNITINIHVKDERAQMRKH